MVEDRYNEVWNWNGAHVLRRSKMAIWSRTCIGCGNLFETPRDNNADHPPMRIRHRYKRGSLPFSVPPMKDESFIAVDGEWVPTRDRGTLLYVALCTGPESLRRLVALMALTKGHASSPR